MTSCRNSGTRPRGASTGSRPVWSTPRGTSYTPSPLLHDGRLYVLTDSGLFSSFDAATGKPHYQQARLPNPYNFKASPVGANGKMMFSADGGGLWQDLDDLTALVQGPTAARLFQTNLNEPNAGPFPLVTAVSFSPQDPDLVLAGTNEGGIYVSHGNGAPGTWAHVANSDGATIHQMPNISSGPTTQFCSSDSPRTRQSRKTRPSSS